MWGDVLQARSRTATLDYVPHDILRDAFSPHLSRSGNPSKDSSVCDPGCHDPLIECRFHPFWNRHGADVAALPDQVYHCPVSLPHIVAASVSRMDSITNLPVESVTATTMVA